MDCRVQDDQAWEEPACAAVRPPRLLPKFTAVALVGFGVSALVLHLALEAGWPAWAARLVSLACAMNVTFLINGRFVFKTLTRERFFGQWCAYVTNSAFGNFCSYWVFVALAATHWPVLGNPYVALLAGSAAAWAINFTGARFLVFGDRRALAARCRRMLVSRSRRPAPAQAEPE